MCGVAPFDFFLVCILFLFLPSQSVALKKNRTHKSYYVNVKLEAIYIFHFPNCWSFVVCQYLNTDLCCQILLIFPTSYVLISISPVFIPLLNVDFHPMLGVS